MHSPAWRNALQACPCPDRAQHALDQLLNTPAHHLLEQASPDQATALVALFCGSQTQSELLLNHPDWIDLCLDLEDLRHPRRQQGLQRELQELIVTSLEQDNFPQALQLTRQFKQKAMLRIAARDLARLGNAREVMGEISSVADVTLDAVFRICWQDHVQRLGTPYSQDAEGNWTPACLSVFGLGKLGGQELNYSSDVDLMFVYSDEGTVFREPPQGNEPPGRGISNHQFFQRLTKAYAGELTQLTPDGMLFRVDLRLRPEGNSGPVARSLDSCENYYAQWGQTWERMMLIKARCVAGDHGLAAEFLEMIQPFRYPRFLGYRIVREVAAIKHRIENEVVRLNEIERNVKLGRGGIREIEFLVQTLQILNAGRTPFLQNAQTLPTLEKLTQYKLLEEGQTTALAEAYCFLRDVEHRLQMENNLQTHTLPTDPEARGRLAWLMGFDSLDDFDTALRRRCRQVRAAYDEVVSFDEPESTVSLPSEITGNEEAYREILEKHAFQRVDDSLRLTRLFVEGPGYVHVSPHTMDLARQLLSRLLAHCPQAGSDGTLHLPEKALSDPDRVLARLDSYIGAYGTRAMLYETWVSNPALFQLLMLLFDRSEFLAETAIRTPDLVEEIVGRGQLHRRKRIPQILDDLRHGRDDADQRLWLRRYHQAEIMRIGLRDILGLVDYEQNLFELSALADACLEYALEVVLQHHRLDHPPFAIVGLGKLGGNELTYGSDLDIVFVASNDVEDLEPLKRLAAEIIDLLAGTTELGVAFVVDARLRPYGEKGLLVNSLKAYEDYYRKKAQLWEIQSISRNRPIAGDPEIGNRFLKFTSALTDFTRTESRPACWTSDWRKEIARMRRRIEKERTPAGKNDLAIKTGTGGVMDVEFIAQTLCLEHGWPEPNTLAALARAQVEGELAGPDADTLIHHFRNLRRLEGILRRWSFAGEVLLPDKPDPLRRVAIRCGFPDADAFMADVAESRRIIREIYDRCFPFTPDELKKGS